MSFGLRAAGVTLGVTAVFAAFGFSGLMIVRTPSVPMGLYWRESVRASGLVQGAYVCLRATAPAAPEVLRAGVASGTLPSAWRDEPLVKRIEGVAGERITYTEGYGVCVEGRVLPASKLLSQDSQGHALPQTTFPRALVAGEVWLASEHARGFDSRYMGAVSTEALTCIARPLWTF